MTDPIEALVVGSSTDLLWAIPDILARAGISVEMISTSQLVRSSKYVRALYTPKSFFEMVQLTHQHICSRIKPYDWVIVGDDTTLHALSKLEWPSGARPGFLQAEGDTQHCHLYSKIGLSRVLSAGGIQTPPFRTAANLQEALAAASELGYPVFLKRDASVGGVGVCLCSTEEDFRIHEWMFEKTPLLVQKKIDGCELDLSAIYIKHELVHFAYAKILRTVGQFKPSSVRLYFPLPMVEEEVFHEIAALGRVLGADGFVNITCIEAADGSGRYYFEADMRPNVWVNASTFYGEDPAQRIRDWFASRTPFSKSSIATASEYSPCRIPYPLRLSFWELALNRYEAWRFMPPATTLQLLQLLAQKAYWDNYTRCWHFFPRGFRRLIKRLLIAARLYRVDR